jgi:integrase/recombinase XerD
MRITGKQAQTLVGPLLQTFFMDHLYHHKCVSPRTVRSYRDTFRLLLQYLQKTIDREPATLLIGDLDAPAILNFLESLEQERHNQPQSRNVRLAAIRSFFRWVALRDPQSVGITTRVLAIPLKRADKRLVGFLTREEVDSILAANDLSEWSGRRDHVLLLTMYNTGARVSEVISLQRQQFSFGIKSFVQFKGKGRKERSLPLWPTTVKALQAWFRELSDKPGTPVFPNARGSALTRDGVNYILQQAVGRAAEGCLSLKNKHVSPHLVRHTCALHLLQSGVDITVIALWLGHESIQTTHGYVEADMILKEQALQKVMPAGQAVSRFKADDAPLRFLASL